MMKQFFSLFTLFTLLSLPFAQGQVVINEVQYVGSDQIELKNTGSGMVDVSNWWLCYRFVYRQLSAANITVTGNTLMQQGDIITISGTGLSLDDISSDLGIYNSSSFGSTGAMQDFVQWGAGGIGREPVAVAKGIWTAGDFVPTVSGSNSSIEWDGLGDGSAFWVEQPTPTFGSENDAAQTCDGGMVSFEGSASDSMTVCIDGSTQVLSFDSANTVGSNFIYVITDDQGVILGLPPGDMANFGPAGPGVCYVWGLSYDGMLLAQPGQNATTATLADSCFDLSDNFLVVVRDSVSGGSTVTDENGADTVYVCIDGTDQFVSFDSVGVFGSNFAYVVTDDQGNILGLPPGDQVNFAPAGTGVCYVWGLSYTGSVTAQLGDNALNVPLSDGCFDLSDNFLTVIRDTLSGGNITDSNGADSVFVCIDGSPQVISFDSSNVVGPNFAYVVTDDQGNILGLPPGDMVNFGPAGPGVCWVWGLSYSGNVTAMVGDNALNVALSDGCFDLSDDFLVVVRDSVSGGSTVTDENGADTVFVCIDGTDQFVSFDSANVFGSNFAYVVTDDQGIILGLPPGDQVNFGPAGVGVCYVWGLSYTGSVTAQLGDNALNVALSDGCFDLSDNFLTVIRDSLSGGIISAESGDDTVYVCLDGNPQVVAFDSTATCGQNFNYVVTDNQGTILGLPPADMVNFAPAGTGECWVWGLSYTGNLTAMVGQNALSVPLSDGSFDLSDDFVVVFRDSVSGGMVSAADGSDSVFVCIDGNDQFVSFDSSNVAGPNFAYVITDDQGNILGLPPGDMANFGPAGPGICWVWGLSYSGAVTAQVGDNALQVDLASGCFDLSDNFLVVVRDSVSGGLITDENGADTVRVCLDGTDQVISFDSSEVFGENFAYVITDDQGNILGLPPGDMANFGPAGPGICYVWGLSYTGNVTAMPGDNALQVDLSDGCFDLSDNFLVVLRDSVSGGSTVTSPDAVSDTVFVCIDGNDQFVSFDSADVFGENFAYVITDDQGTILGLPPGDMANFGPAGVGVCYVWGLSYTGNVTAQVGDNAMAVDLSDGCFDLSDEFLVVYRDSAFCTTDIEDELPLGTISVFPNPVADQLNIRFDLSSVQFDGADLRVFDLTGREIYRESLSTAGSEHQIATGNWQTGLYIVEVRTTEGVFRSRLLKE